MTQLGLNWYKGRRLKLKDRMPVMLLRFTLLVALTSAAAPSASGETIWLNDGFPTCAEAKAVGPALAAKRRGDYPQLERLGCVPYTPRDIRVRVIACASSVGGQGATMVRVSNRAR